MSSHARAGAHPVFTVLLKVVAWLACPPAHTPLAPAATPLGASPLPGTVPRQQETRRFATATSLQQRQRPLPSVRQRSGQQRQPVAMSWLSPATATLIPGAATSGPRGSSAAGTDSPISSTSRHLRQLDLRGLDHSGSCAAGLTVAAGSFLAAARSSNMTPRPLSLAAARAATTASTQAGSDRGFLGRGDHLHPVGLRPDYPGSSGPAHPPVSAASVAVRRLPGGISPGRRCPDCSSTALPTRSSPTTVCSARARCSRCFAASRRRPGWPPCALRPNPQLVTHSITSLHFPRPGSRAGTTACGARACAQPRRGRPRSRDRGERESGTAPCIQHRPPSS